MGNWNTYYERGSNRHARIRNQGPGLSVLNQMKSSGWYGNRFCDHRDIEKFLFLLWTSRPEFWMTSLKYIKLHQFQTGICSQVWILKDKVQLLHIQNVDKIILVTISEGDCRYYSPKLEMLIWNYYELIYHRLRVMCQATSVVVFTIKTFFRITRYSRKKTDWFFFGLSSLCALFKNKKYF